MIRAELAPLELPPAPAWARPGGSFRENSEGDALYFAGAALAALDSVAKSDPPWAGVWRRRLALKSAAAVAQNLLNRREDEAALRDAVALGKPGQELGPGGRVYSAFRTLAGPGDPLRPARLAAVAADLQAPFVSGNAAELAAALRETGGRGRPAPIAAAAAAAAVIALKPDAEPLAIWAADASLARALSWPTPLPLLAGELFLRRATGEGRRPRPGEANWGKLVALAYARAGRCCMDQRGDHGGPFPLRVHAMRMEIGRPSSSMRFKTRTATATSVVRRSSLRKRSPSPITCLYRPMAVSMRLRLL